MQETKIIIFVFSSGEKQTSVQLPRKCRFWKCMNIKLCQHIKLAGILSRGMRFFSEITLHPSAPLNSAQGASGDTLIGLICIWANKQVVPRGPLCAAFLKNFSGIKGPNIIGCHVE